MQIFFLILAAIAALLFFYCLGKVGRGEFYSDSFCLSVFGVYVYGDGLVLFPFWFLSGILFMFLPGLWIIRYLIIFFLTRSFFEVIYWLNHQAVEKEYKAPLFRKIKSLDSQTAAILYQLIHSCVVVVSFFLLLFSFSI